MGFNEPEIGRSAVRPRPWPPSRSATQWTFEEVDSRPQRIMADSHATASERAAEFGDQGNLVLEANIAGFRKVADAMLKQGVL